MRIGERCGGQADKTNDMVRALEKENNAMTYNFIMDTMMTEQEVNSQ